MPRCVIVGAGDVDCKIDVWKGDFVIAADGGYAHLCKQNITPDLILGDFDSYDGKLPEGVEIIKFPVEKDETDMHLAYVEGKKRGFSDYAIYGALGGRLDHTLANLSLLYMINQDGNFASIHGAAFRALVISGGAEMRFDAREKGTVSVFAIGGIARGVNIKGLKYEAENVTLTEGFALGVSNSFVGKEASVSVEVGSLLITCCG